MKNLLLIASALLLGASVFPSRLAAQGEDNPTGVSGIYNGNVTTGCSWDPYTQNALREIVDIVVPGSVGKYPLKWARYWNTRGNVLSGYSYGYSLDESTLIAGFPDGRQISCWDQCPTGIEEQVGNPLILADGGQVVFASYQWQSNGHTSHYPTQLIDPYGQVTTYSYVIVGYQGSDPVRRLDKITEPGGRYLQLNYSTQNDPTNLGVITSVQAFDGQGHMIDSVTYTYASTATHTTATGMTRAAYSDGTFATYTYEPNGGPGNHYRLATCDDVRYAGPMRQIKYDYGQTRSLIKSERNLVTGEAVSTSSTTNNQAQQGQRGEIRGDGATRIFAYGQRNGVEKGRLAWYTDFAGSRTTLGYSYWTFIGSVTDANNHTTTYTRGDPYASPSQDPAGIYRITHPDGSHIDQTFARGPSGWLTDHAYLASRTDELGNKTTYTRDSNMRITRKDYPDGAYETFNYNGFGEVLTHRMTSGGTESFVYDARGLKTSSTDAASNVTAFIYYPDGDSNYVAWTDRLKKVTHPPNRSNLQAFDIYEYDRNAAGQPCAGRALVTKITHADGTFVTNVYDNYGNLTSTSDELGHTTTHTYDDYGRLVSTTTPKRTTTDTLSHTTTNSYVPTGYTSSYITTSALPFTVTVPSGKTTNTYYDANWRKTRVQQAPGTVDETNSYFTYDPVGNLSTVKDPRNNVTAYGYDIRNRQTSITDALNHTTSFTYDALNKKSETHANGELITYDTYDPMNRLTHKTVKRDGTTNDVTSMTYDLAGNLKTTTDERGNIYTYNYDSMNRRISMIYPNTLHEDTSYDGAGKVATYTNRNGNVQTFDYDNRNRETYFSWNDGGTTPYRYTEYDQVSRIVHISNAASMTNYGSAIFYTYYDDNLLNTEKEFTSAFSDYVNRTVTYTYDADGNRATVQYPSGSSFSYAYTNRNQVSSIGATGQQNPIVSYTYDPSGNPLTRALDNGTSTAFTVDTVNRDTAVQHSLVSGAKRFDYAYNAVNDILAVQRDSGLGDGFEYDLTQQTTKFHQNGTVDLAASTVTNPAADNNLVFDGCGNRTSLNGVPQSFDVMNQLSNTAGVHYDLNGNLDAWNGWSYTYDAQNRLTHVTKGATTADFYYDGKNRQIARSINGTVTFSVWDDWELIEEYGTGNVRTSAYLQGAHGPVKSLMAGIYFYQDELGSTSHIANASGQLLESYRYGLYGKPTYYNAAGTQIAASACNVHDLFAGERFVTELGLYDLRNRYMSPDLGRFLQPDPIGFKGDRSNLYRYCGNDWASKTDPMGLQEEDPPEERVAEEINPAEARLREAERSLREETSEERTRRASDEKIDRALKKELAAARKDKEAGQRYEEMLKEQERNPEYRIEKSRQRDKQEINEEGKKKLEELQKSRESKKQEMNEEGKKKLEELQKSKESEKAPEAKTVEPRKEAPKPSITPDNSQGQHGGDDISLKNG